MKSKKIRLLILIAVTVCLVIGLMPVLLDAINNWQNSQPIDQSSQQSTAKSSPNSKDNDRVKKLRVGQVYRLWGGFDLRREDGEYLKLTDENRWIMYDRLLNPIRDDEQTWDPYLNIYEGTYTKKNGNIFFGKEQSGLSLRFSNQSYVKEKVTYSSLTITTSPMTRSKSKKGDIFLYKGRYSMGVNNIPICYAKGKLPNSVEEFIADYVSDPSLKPDNQ